MEQKILKINIYQPFAHYRVPKIMQDDYIPTLPLPPATTITGLVSYLVDRDIKEEINVGLVGNYKNKITNFIRGEHLNSWEMPKKTKKDKTKKLDYPYYNRDYKINRIMNYEILQDVNLTVFLKFKNQEDFVRVKDAFETPRRYLSLGRKEDFLFLGEEENGKIIPKKVQEIEIEEIPISEKKDAIKKDIILKNTYVSIFDFDKEKNLCNSGVLYILPKTVKDFQNTEKQDRKFIYQNYIYLNENGFYPDDGVLSYDHDSKIAFKWLKED